MSPQRWGQSGDDSQVFAYLANQAEITRDAEARRLDARREADRAAQDQQIFDRYDAGKVSDDELMAYIRKRIDETGYDKSQQANWKKALLQYGEKIDDTRAQATFERTQDYSAYIAYLRNKLAHTKDADGKLTIQQQIRALMDERSSKSLSRGAQKIVSDIQLNRATNADLVQFYEEQRRNLRPGSPLRDTITKALDDARVNMAQQAFEQQLGDIERQIQRRTMTPVEASAAMRDLVQGSSLLQTDTSRYYALMDAANKLRYSPDPAELARLGLQLQRGDITPDQYQDRMNLMADRLATYDLKGSYDLRSQALTEVQRARAQIDANVIDTSYLAGDYTGAFSFVGQMDGSAYAAQNCVQAGAATLATALGYKGLSGGDLRYLTGDREGGTNIDQAMYALDKAGVDTSGLRNRDDMAFERFKRAVGNGSGALLMGSNALLPDSLKSSPGLTGAHALNVMRYDPKKNVFLILNPGISRAGYKGDWVSADIVQNFGWGQGAGFSGRVLLTQPNTIKLGESPSYTIINVDTPPQRKGTPKSYVGLYNPGVSGRSKGIRQSRGVDDTLPAPGTDQKEWANRQLDKHQKRLDEIVTWSDAFNKGETSIGEGEDRVDLTPELMKALDRETIDRMEREIHLQQSLGQFGNAETLRNQRASFINDAKIRNSIPAEQLWNTLLRDISGTFANVAYSNDPAKRLEVAQRARNAIETFISVKSRQNKDELVGIDPDVTGPNLEERMRATLEVIDFAINPEVTMDDKRKSVGEAADMLGADLPGNFLDPGKEEGASNDLGKIIASVAGISNDKSMIDKGQGEAVIINGDMVVLPYRQETRLVKDPATGVMVPQLQNVLDTSGIKGALDASRWPTIMVNDATGRPIPMRIMPTQTAPLKFVKVLANYDGIGLDGRAYSLKKGTFLNDKQLWAILGPTKITELVNEGKLQRGGPGAEWGLMQVVTPTEIIDGNPVLGTVSVQNPKSHLWSEGVLPIFVVSNGNALPDITDTIGMDDRGQPEVEYRPFADRAEVPFPLGVGVSRVEVQRQINDGEIEVPQNFSIDITGEVTSEPSDVSESYAPRWAMPGWSPFDIQGAEGPDGRDEILRLRTRVDDAVKAAKDRAEAAGIRLGFPDERPDLFPPSDSDVGSRAVYLGLPSPGAVGGRGRDPRFEDAGGTIADTGWLEDINNIARGIGVNMPKVPQRVQSYRPPAPARTIDSLRARDKRGLNLPRVTTPTLRTQIEDAGGVLSGRTLGTSGGFGGSGSTTGQPGRLSPMERDQQADKALKSQPFVPPTPGKAEVSSSPSGIRRILSGGRRIVAS